MAYYKSLAVLVGFICTLALTTVGCGGSDIPAGNIGKGGLVVLLTDAPTDSLQNVYVTIEKVQVLPGEEASGDGTAVEVTNVNTDNDVVESGEATADENDWITILTPHLTVDLLTLQDNVMVELGIATLDAGYYSRVRLILGTNPVVSPNSLGEIHPFANYAISTDGSSQEIQVPSGYQTGIKLLAGFEVTEQETTIVILDFDAAKSIVSSGTGEDLILKPTISVRGPEDS